MLKNHALVHITDLRYLDKKFRIGSATVRGKIVKAILLIPDWFLGAFVSNKSIFSERYQDSQPFNAPVKSTSREYSWNCAFCYRSLVTNTTLSRIKHFETAYSFIHFSMLIPIQPCVSKFLSNVWHLKDSSKRPKSCAELKPPSEHHRLWPAN